MSQDIVTQLPRGWAPYRVVARDYLHISEDILLGAIKAGKLRAYEKPMTRGRRKQGAREYRQIWVNLSDVDEYIRAEWEPYPIR